MTTVEDFRIALKEARDKAEELTPCESLKMPELRKIRDQLTECLYLTRPRC